MTDEKCFIPRNVIYSDDTFPIDFIVHIELQKRQIPYVLLGTTIGALAVTSSGTIVPITLVTKGIINAANVANINYITKGIIAVLSLGSSYILSQFKTQNQHLEELLNNLVKYNKDLIQFKFERRNLNEKSFKGGIPKFAIKK